MHATLTEGGVNSRTGSKINAILAQYHTDPQHIDFQATGMGQRYMLRVPQEDRSFTMYKISSKPGLPIMDLNVGGIHAKVDDVTMWIPLQFNHDFLFSFEGDQNPELIFASPRGIVLNHHGKLIFPFTNEKREEFLAHIKSYSPF